MRLPRFVAITFVVLFLVVWTSCGSVGEKQTSQSQTPTQKEQAKPTLYTAQQAFNMMHGYAQKQWASDALPVHIESELTSEADGHDGKATVWKGVFVSPSRGKARNFVFSGSALPDAPPRGISATAAEYPLTSDLAALQFQPFLLKANSDRAYKESVDHGGSRLLKKEPNTKINYFVEFDRKSSAPLWYVIYGDSVQSNKGIGVVHGITGEFVKAVNTSNAPASAKQKPSAAQ